MGGSPAGAAPTQVAPWGTRAEAPGPPLRHQRQVLRQQNGGPMAHAPHAYWQGAHDVWLLSPRAAGGCLGTRDGPPAAVGTPKPGAPARTVRGLCRQPAYQDGDARGGGRL